MRRPADMVNVLMSGRGDAFVVSVCRVCLRRRPLFGGGVCSAVWLTPDVAHLLNLEALADHLAGDRGLVRLLDCLRHIARVSQRASRAAAATVLAAPGLFLVADTAVHHSILRSSHLARIPTLSPTFKAPITT